MSQFRIDDIRELEGAAVSPGHLRSKVGEMILSSAVCRAKVESANPATGEYRVVLQGTLGAESGAPAKQTKWG